MEKPEIITINKLLKENFMGRFRFVQDCKDNIWAEYSLIQIDGKAAVVDMNRLVGFLLSDNEKLLDEPVMIRESGR